MARPSFQRRARVHVGRPAAASISRASATGALDDVVGTAALEHLDGLADLERVAGGEAQRRCMSVRSATV